MPLIYTYCEQMKLFLALTVLTVMALAVESQITIKCDNTDCLKDAFSAFGKGMGSMFDKGPTTESPFDKRVREKSEEQAKWFDEQSKKLFGSK